MKHDLEPFDLTYKTVECKWCGYPTVNIKSRECNVCYSIYLRLYANPTRALLMLKDIAEKRRRGRKEEALPRKETQNETS